MLALCSTLNHPGSGELLARKGHDATLRNLNAFTHSSLLSGDDSKAGELAFSRERHQADVTVHQKFPRIGTRQEFTIHLFFNSSVGIFSRRI